MSGQRHRLHAQIFGRVQGVSFRFHTLTTANDLKLVGWVRNLSDGSVEVVAEGSRPALEQLLRFLEQGPQGAHVTRVDANWLSANNEFADFQVR
jgi:acylphosphatase